MKKVAIGLLVLVIGIIIAAGCVSAFAEPGGSCGANAAWSLNEDTGVLSITGYGTMTTHPWNTNGAYSDSILEVDIEDGITSICDSAFQACQYITTITIPQSVTSIGESAFSGCKSIRSITIPNGVTVIGAYTFNGCGNEDTAVYLPDNITLVVKDNYSYSRGAFSNYAGSIFCSFGSSTARALGIYADYGNYGSGAGYSFRPNDNPDVKIYDATGNSSGGNSISAYGANPNAVSLIIPEGVTQVDMGAFKGYTKLQSISLPHTLKQIGNDAFTNCSSLETISLPSSFSGSIGSSTGLSSLQSVHFPFGVFGTFDNCKWGSCGDNVSYRFDQDKTLTVFGSGDMWDSSSESPFKNVANNTQINTIIVEQGVTSIGDYAFANRYDVRSIMLPEGITRLGKYAFYNVSNQGKYYTSGQIHEIHLPSTVKIIDDDCFNNASYLVQISMLDGVETIGARAFYGCKTLSQLSIPASVYSLGARAFSSCAELTELGDLSGLRDVNENAFLQCDATLYAEIGSEGAKTLSRMGRTFFTKDYPYVELRYSFEGDLPTDLSVIGFKNTIENVAIPEGVTNIKENVFANTNIHTVSFPETLISISDNAFEGCSNLTELELPRNLEVIGDSAFSGCIRLQDVVLPDKLDSIGAYAFKDCSDLGQITIHNPECSLGSYAFGSCGNLLKVLVPGNLSNNVDNTVFSSCDKLVTMEFTGDVTAPLFERYPSLYQQIKNVVLADDVITIGASVFDGCNAIENIQFSDSLETIGENAFRNCSAITTIILPESVTSVGKGAFYGCSAVAVFRLSSGMTEISEQMFRNCGSLEEIDIPENIIHIRKNAFYGCESLTNIAFHSKMDSIGASAFFNCSNLSTITIPGNFSGVAANAFTDCTKLKTITVIGDITIHFEEIYPELAAQIEMVTVENGSAVIGEDAFSNCIRLKNIILPESISDIQSRAFSGCVKLENVILPGSVETIGSEAFSNCKLIRKLNIPAQVKSIGANAFNNCTNLKELSIYGQSITVDNTAFTACESLESITLLNNMNTELSTICPGAYLQIKEIKISNGVTGIGASAFAGCSGIQSVELPDSLLTVGENAFKDCTGITQLTIPGELDDVDASAFDGCERIIKLSVSGDMSISLRQVYPGIYGQLEQVAIGNDVNQITRSAFRGCSNLKTLTVDEDNSSFMVQEGVLFDKALNRLVFCPNKFTGAYVIPDGIRYINNYAFSNCNELETIYLPDSIESIENNAFLSCNAVLVMNCCSYADSWAESQELSHQLLHDWAAPAYEWDEDYNHVTATRMCKRDNTHFESETVAAASEKTKDPDCTTFGETTYTSESFENAAFEAQCVTLADIPALGHAWGEAEYVWDEENKEVTAIRVCGNDGDHIETETVLVTSEVTKQPTCTEMGDTTYTSGEFQNEAFAVQTRTVTDVDVLGHEWSEPEYTWNEENSEVTATRVCAHDTEHVETETVQVTSEVTLQPTCTEMGETTYRSGEFQNKAFESQTKILTDLDALGHDWSEPEYTWNEENTEVTATRVCNRDAEHVETETVLVTSEVTKQPTCTEMGDTTYTSGEFQNEAFAVQTKTVTDVDALGHDWSEPEYTWNEENTEVTAKRACSHDAEHMETETVQATSKVTLLPSFEEMGEIAFVSESFQNESFTIQVKADRTIPALSTLSMPTFPAQLTTIEDEAFEGVSFQAVIIPDTVTTIGSRAFADCQNLIYVYIPASVTSIAQDAFADCPDVIIVREDE